MSRSLVDHALSRYRLAGANLISDRNPFFLPVDGFRLAREREGQSVVSFAHYDYLGLSTHPDVVMSAHRMLDSLGPSVSASRMVGGERMLHGDLEEELAAFVGTEAALTLVSGYLTNVTLLAHLMSSQDLILYDELCHNSIVVGTRAARCDSHPFAHNDLSDLRRKLAAMRGRYKRCLIVVEGLYSMDGDVADLPELVKIKNEHDCWLMVDEAHSIGTLGSSGRGLCEHFNVDVADVDLIVGTLSKAFVSSGGFIAGHGAVIRWLRYTLPGFVFSVGLAPSVAASALSALRVLKREPALTEILRKKSRHFLREAERLGLDTGPAIGVGVVPVLMKNEQAVLEASELLKQAGYYVPPIVRIGVPKEKPRLRFFISALHEDRDISRALETLINRAPVSYDATARSESV
ncbi:MAG: aminotransferase class I/II-fold pyridoxal phosphate-dependent enzyme [Afipia sp.]